MLPGWLPKVAPVVAPQGGSPKCLPQVTPRGGSPRWLTVQGYGAQNVFMGCLGCRWDPNCFIASLYTSVACHLPSPWESLAVQPVGLPQLPWLVPISIGNNTSVGHCPFALLISHIFLM